MTQTFANGDRVEWGDRDDPVRGTIQRKLTAPYEIKGFTAQASRDEPMYLVKTDGAGAEAAHKPETLRKV